MVALGKTEGYRHKRIQHSMLCAWGVRDWAILYQASVSEEGATTVRYWGQHVRVLILRVSLDPREILVPLTKAYTMPRASVTL